MGVRRWTSSRGCFCLSEAFGWAKHSIHPNYLYPPLAAGFFYNLHVVRDIRAAEFIRVVLARTAHNTVAGLAAGYASIQMPFSTKPKESPHVMRTPGKEPEWCFQY